MHTDRAAPLPAKEPSVNLAQAIEHANALSLPGFFSDNATLVAEREKNEEACSPTHG